MLKPVMIADEADPYRSLLELSYPMKEGIIVDDNDFELLYNYILNKKLGLDRNKLNHRKLLFTEGPNNSDLNRKKLAEIAFEKIGVGYFNIESQAKLTLCCEGL